MSTPLQWRCCPHPRPASMVDGAYYPIAARAPGEAARRFAEAHPGLSAADVDTEEWAVDVAPSTWPEDNAPQALALFALTPEKPARFRVTRGWRVEVVQGVEA